MSEDITEEEIETMQPSKVYMQCVKDRPTNVFPQLRTTDDFERYTKSLAEVKKGQNVENILSAAIQLCDNDLHKNGFASTCELMTAIANPTLVRTYPLAELNEKFQKVKDFLEDIDSAENVETESINEKARIYWEETGSIKRVDQMGGIHLQRREWEDFVKEVKANLAVLKIAKRIVQPILESYLSESALRNDKKKIKQITTQMADLAKQAARVKSTIVQANEKAETTKAKGHQIDIKTANAYIDALSKFNDLSDQYFNLNKQLRFCTNEPNDSLNILDFPGLTSTDISTEHSIKKAWRNSA